MNRKDLRASTLVGLNWENPVLDPLAVQAVILSIGAPLLVMNLNLKKLKVKSCQSLTFWIAHSAR